MTSRLLSNAILCALLGLATPLAASADDPALLPDAKKDVESNPFAKEDAPDANSYWAGTNDPDAVAKPGDVPGECCDLCDDCSEDCGWDWIAGTEATFLDAQVDNSGGFALASDLTGPSIINDSASTGGFQDMTFAPRVWLGMQGECWGLVGRFFYLSDSTNDFSPVVFGSGLALSERLKLYTTDLEAVRSGYVKNTKVDASFGVRYASVETGGSNATASILGQDLITASALTNSSFNGTGLTGGLTGRTQVRNCSNLYWIWSARGSVLWGDSFSVVQTAAAVNSLNANAASVNFALGESDDAMFIGELQLGLQWEHELKCIPANAFVRIAGEYQTWTAELPRAFAVSGAAVGSSGALAFAEAGDTDVTLAGFSIGTGFTW